MRSSMSLLERYFGDRRFAPRARLCRFHQGDSRLKESMINLTKSIINRQPKHQLMLNALAMVFAACHQIPHFAKGSVKKVLRWTLQPATKSRISPKGA